MKDCRSMRLLRRDRVEVRRIASSSCTSRASLSSTSCDAQRKGATFSLLLSSGWSAADGREEQPPSRRELPWLSFSSSDESPNSELPRMERREEVELRDEKRLAPRMYRGLEGVEVVEAELVEYEEEPLLAFCTLS